MILKGNTPPCPAVERARRRKMRRAFCWNVVALLALLAVAGGVGFAVGVWREVAEAPQAYVTGSAPKGAGGLEAWSTEAGQLVARLQGARLMLDEVPVERHDPQPTVDAGATDPAPDVERPPGYAEPDLSPPEVDAEPSPDAEPDLLPPEVDAEPSPVDDLPEPSVTDDVDSGPVDEEPAPRERTEEEVTEDLLARADEAYGVAMAQSRKAGPNAPARGRKAATKRAIELLTRAQGLYEDVLERPLSAQVRSYAEGRIALVNAQIYWCRKFSPVGP